VAAATEGAFAGLPSIAFSLGIEGDKFAEVSGARGHRDEVGDAITRVAAERCRQLNHELISAELAQEEGARPFVVHNVNLPPHVGLDTPVRRTCSARALMPSLFERVSGEAPSALSSEGEGFELRFSFARDWSYMHNPSSSDLEVYRAGEISHCVLDWRELGS
jgi:broad specificity polyphosphatase/5'/3'-nucleotidase SurE